MGSPPQYAPTALPKLKATCTKAAPIISPPLEKRNSSSCCGADTPNRQAVQTQLVSTVADSYYTLLMLDNQLGINTETRKNWTETIRMLEALKKNGRSNETAILQA